MNRKTTVAFWSAAMLVVTAITLLTLRAADAISTTDPAPILKPAILCAGLVGLNITSYAVWFNRWNVVAHGQLVFSVVAYVIPIYQLDALDLLSGEALDLYYRVIAVGFACCMVGTLIGASLASPTQAARSARRWDFDTAIDGPLAKRTTRLVVLSVLGVIASFAVMRFVPALAPDPLTAKFFRGPYADAYRPIAPLYRFSTTAISLLMPLVTLYAWRRRNLASVTLLAASVGVMMLGLLREPALSGVLLFIGALLAVRKRLLLYFAVLAGAYFAGAAMYALLGSLGVGAYATSQFTNATSLFAQVASGAPDLRDQVGFLQAWTGRPEYTQGLTFIGGLVPGNFQWNPSVWSLHVVNPSQSIESISSGGLRLPAPLWGLVSFGWPGVVAVSLLNGVIVGWLARRFRDIVTGTTLTSAVCWLVLYSAILDVAPVFYRLGYLSIIQLALVLWLFRAARSDRADDMHRPVQDQAGGVRLGDAGRPGHDRQRTVSRRGDLLHHH